MSVRTRNSAHLPSKGWVRFRHWLGAGSKQIGNEVEALHLPSYVPGAQDKVRDILSDAPKPPIAPHLKAIDGGKARKPAPEKPAKKPRRRKKTDLRTFLVSVYDESERDDTYITANRLDYYAESAAGRIAARNALELWCEGGELREIAMDALVAGNTPEETAALLRKYATKAQARRLRNVDVTAFRDLFWDYRGLGPPQIHAFLRTNQVTAFGSLALTHGMDVVLARLGRETLNYSPGGAKAMMEQTLQGWLMHQMRFPEDASINELAQAAHLVEHLQELKTAGEEGASAEAMRELRQVGVRLLAPATIPSFFDVLTTTTAAQRTEDVERALSMGAVTSAEAEEYLERIEQGYDFGTEVRDKIHEATQNTGTEVILAP